MPVPRADQITSWTVMMSYVGCPIPRMYGCSPDDGRWHQLSSILLLVSDAAIFFPHLTRAGHYTLELQTNLREDESFTSTEEATLSCLVKSAIDTMPTKLTIPYGLCIDVPISCLLTMHLI